MEIRIQGKTYHPEKEVIMIKLNAFDKQSIAGMENTTTIYCGFPDTYTKEQRAKVKKMMREFKNDSKKK